MATWRLASIVSSRWVLGKQQQVPTAHDFGRLVAPVDRLHGVQELWPPLSLGLRERRIEMAAGQHESFAAFKWLR